jgi:hypothetical protein
MEIRNSEGKYSVTLMQKMATVAATADGLSIEGNNFKVSALIGCPDMVLFACEEIARLESMCKTLTTMEFTHYTTNPAESVAGIALRQLGDERLWVEIARLNSLKFPDVNANDYYPVGTMLVIPLRKVE